LYGLSPEKMADLRCATLRVLAIDGFVPGSCSVAEVHSQLVGRWIWASPPVRPALCVLNNVFHFLSRFGATPRARRSLRPLWASVRRELQVMCFLAPLLCCDLRRRLYPTV